MAFMIQNRLTSLLTAGTAVAVFTLLALFLMMPQAQAQDASAPAKPTGLAAQATHDSVNLTWVDPNDPSITHYRILRRDRAIHGPGEFITIESNTGSANTSYTDDTVEPEQTYVYRVKAVNQHGDSEQSDYARADTPAAPAPAKPTGLAAQAAHDSVTLTWDDPGDASITHHQVLRRIPGVHRIGEFVTIEPNTGSAATSYTDGTVEPETRYVYRTKAVNDHGASPSSDYIDPTTPAAPGAVTPTPSPSQDNPGYRASSALTVGNLPGGGLGYDGTDGSLTEMTFVHRDKPYTIGSIRWDSADDTLQVAVAPALDSQHQGQLTLHVDDNLLNFKDAATPSSGAYQWDIDLEWADDDSAQLRVSSGIGTPMTVTTANVSPGGGEPAYGWVARADLTPPYNEGGSMSHLEFEYSRYDDHKFEAIVRDTGHTPDSFVVFISPGLSAKKRQRTALRVDGEMYHFADSVSAPEIDPGRIYHIPRRWDAPNLDWDAGETHEVAPTLLSRWGTAPAKVSITNQDLGPWGRFFGVGGHINVRVTFSGPVDVDAVNNPPNIDLPIDSGARLMTYQGGSGTKHLDFRYTVQQGDYDETGLSIAANALSGAITAASGSIILSHPELPQNFSYMVDAVPPVLESAIIVGNELTLTFDESMKSNVEDPPSSFIVNDVLQQVEVNRTVISGKQAVLHLAREVGDSNPVTLTYTPGGKHLLQDRGGNRMPGFSNRSVTNNTPQPLETSLPSSAFSSLRHSGAGDRPQVVFDFSREVSDFTASSPSLSVTNGTIAGVQQHYEAGLDHAWIAFIAPAGNKDVYFTLIPGKACHNGGICAPDGVRLDKGTGFHIIAGPDSESGPAPGQLVGILEDVPDAHNGSDLFKFRIRFGRSVNIGQAALRDDTMDITNASPTNAGRVPGQPGLWEVTLQPQGKRDVTVVLPATRDCAHFAAVCTGDGRKMSNQLELTVPGPGN